MNIRRLMPRFALCLSLVTVGCALDPTPTHSSADDALIRIDQDYNDYNREFGFKQATEAYFDFGSAFIIEAGEGILTGEETILSKRNFDQAPSPVYWNPTGSMSSKSADLGITWGSFGIDGAPDEKGSYLTVWRKVDGEWKIVTDLAVNDPSFD